MDDSGNMICDIISWLNDMPKAIGSQTARELQLPELSANRKKKVVDYLMNSWKYDQKESAWDFVQNSRRILWKQISINDKIEETEWLKEFIIMEEEQLQEKHKTFDEDVQSF